MIGDYNTVRDISLRNNFYLQIDNWCDMYWKDNVCDVMFDDESEWQRLVRSEQKRWTSVCSGMFECDVMFDDESVWQSLVGSEQKRWT